MNLAPNKQFLINVPFQSISYRKKELCVNNEVQETNGDVYCPTCRNEKCVYISIKTTSSFNDCKKCNACCHVFNIPFKDQTPPNMLFGSDSTHCFAKKTSRNYKKEKSLPFLKKFLRISTPNGDKKSKDSSIYGINVSTPLRFIQLTKNFLHSHFLHFQSTVKQHCFLTL